MFGYDTYLFKIACDFIENGIEYRIGLISVFLLFIVIGKLKERKVVQ